MAYDEINGVITTSDGKHRWTLERMRRWQTLTKSVDEKWHDATVVRGSLHYMIVPPPNQSDCPYCREMAESVTDNVTKYLNANTVRCRLDGDSANECIVRSVFGDSCHTLLNRAVLQGSVRPIHDAIEQIKNALQNSIEKQTSTPTGTALDPQGRIYAVARDGTLEQPLRMMAQGDVMAWSRRTGEVIAKWSAVGVARAFANGEQQYPHSCPYCQAANSCNNCIVTLTVNSEGCRPIIDDALRVRSLEPVHAALSKITDHLSRTADYNNRLQFQRNMCVGDSMYRDIAVDPGVPLSYESFMKALKHQSRSEYHNVGDGTIITEHDYAPIKLDDGAVLSEIEAHMWMAATALVEKRWASARVEILESIGVGLCAYCELSSALERPFELRCNNCIVNLAFNQPCHKTINSALQDGSLDTVNESIAIIKARLKATLKYHAARAKPADTPSSATVTVSDLIAAGAKRQHLLTLFLKGIIDLSGNNLKMLHSKLYAMARLGDDLTTTPEDQLAHIAREVLLAVNTLRRERQPTIPFERMWLSVVDVQRREGSRQRYDVVAADRDNDQSETLFSLSVTKTQADIGRVVAILQRVFRVFNAAVCGMDKKS